MPEQIENNDTQEAYWELQKFLVMALKANPNLLECLHTPFVEHATPLAEELVAHRKVFLSKLIYQTYNGYVMSQFKKLEQDLRARGEIKWKHAMHLMRLLLSGISALREGNLRDELLWVTWDQDLGRDAAFVVMGAADISKLDDRSYREAQLKAGIVEGRLHIAAYALGIGASGMTFLDSEIEGLFRAPLGALLFTCVGVPTYRSTAGGRPGAPVAVVTPTAGETPTT